MTEARRRFYGNLIRLTFVIYGLCNAIAVVVLWRRGFWLAAVIAVMAVAAAVYGFIDLSGRMRRHHSALMSEPSASDSSRWWLMRVNDWCWFRWVQAAPPCMKGECQVGYLVFGWQK